MTHGANLITDNPFGSQLFCDRAAERTGLSGFVEDLVGRSFCVGVVCVDIQLEAVDIIGQC